MKKLGVGIAILLALAASGYFAFEYFIKSDKVDTWGLVPGNAALVYESNDVIKAWNKLQATGIWRNLSQWDSFSRVENDLLLLDSVAGGQGKLHRFLARNDVLISAHTTSRTEFDFVFYVPIFEEAAASDLSRMLSEFETAGDIRREVRVYQGATITSLFNSAKNQSLAYSLLAGHFVASHTPVLVEDVIRNLNEDFANNFQSKNEPLLNAKSLQEDEGNIYIDIANFQTLMETLLKDGLDPITPSQLLSSSILDILVYTDNIALSGFSFPHQGKESYSMTLVDQSPGTFDVRRYIPNRASKVLHINLSNPSLWKQRLEAYSGSGMDLTSEWQELISDFKFDVHSYYSALGGELAYVTLESLRPELPEKLLLLETENISRALKQLDDLAAAASTDTVYYERFADNTIKQIQIDGLPRKIFGQPFPDFQTSFYTEVDQYIAISNSIETLKRLISDYDQENTWGKSLQQSDFIDNSVSDANLSLYINIPRSWSIFMNRAEPGWRSLLTSKSGVLKRFGMIAVQMSYVNNQFYTGVVITHDDEESARATGGFTNLVSVALDTVARTKPWVVRNHVTNAFEMLVQDMANNLYLIAENGEVIWKDSVGTEINFEITQIDFFRNGKLQYFFATDSTLFCIDRNGDNVEGYPRKLEFPIHHMRIIDYDQSRRYRLMVSDVSGNAYMYDMAGNLLDGWNPKSLGGRLAEAPKHFRVRGRDFIVAIQEDGIIHVINRRGETLPGFPINLNANSPNPVFVDVGSNISNTSLTTVTEDGEIVEFNLDGVITDRNQLFKPDANTRFGMAVERSAKTYVIVQVDQNRISILDNQGKLMTEKDYLDAGNFQVQFYSLALGRQLVIVTDPIQQFSYIYNEVGTLVNGQPLSSAFPVAILYSEARRQYKIYSTFGNKVTISTAPAD